MDCLFKKLLNFLKTLLLCSFNKTKGSDDSYFSYFLTLCFPFNFSEKKLKAFLDKKLANRYSNKHAIPLKNFTLYLISNASIKSNLFQ